jgi:hypothetical protein
MAYPNAIVIQVFLNPHRYQYVAQWPPQKCDPALVVPREDVAKEVDLALGQMRSEILKGILEGFPEPEKGDDKPALFGIDGKRVQSNPASAFTEPGSDV